MCTIKEFLQLNNYNLNFREAVAHILEQYYEVGLDEIPLQLESIYDKKKLVAFYDGNYITIDPIASTLSECNIGKILAHELAHYFQWKELSNPSNRSIFLDWLMEKEAGEAEEDFKAIYYGVSPKENKYKLKKKSWGNVEKYFNAKVPFCQKAKYKISAYGIGGFFTVKQVLMDKIGAKDGIDVEHEGCHEKLTRLAYEKYVARDATKKRKIDDKKLDSLITGARMNDFYFFGNLHESVYGETVKNILNNRDAMQKNYDSIIDSNKHAKLSVQGILKDAKTVAHDNFSQVGFNFSLDTFLEIAGDRLLGFLDIANFFNKYTDDEKIKIEKIIKKVGNGLLARLQKNRYVGEFIKKIIIEEINDLSGKKIQIKENVAETIDEILNKIGIEKVIKDAVLRVFKEIFDFWEEPSAESIKEADRKLNEFLINNLINKKTRISNFLDDLMRIVNSGCSSVESVVQTATNSIICFIKEDLGLLNATKGKFEEIDDISIDICGLLEELNKIYGVISFPGSLYCFAQFFQNSHFGDLQFLHSMDCSDKNRLLNTKKCIRFAKFCVSVFLDEDEERKKLRKEKFGDYIVALPEGNELKNMFYPLLVPITTLNAAKYDVKKGNTTDTLLSVLEKKYENGERSYFSQITIEEFFSMKLIQDKTSEKKKDELDWGYVALGMACHMIEDSFTASHVIRAWNINGRKEIKEDADLKGLPPILYCADYKEQSSDRHVYSDLFVTDLTVDDSKDRMSIDNNGAAFACNNSDINGKEVGIPNENLKNELIEENVKQTLNASMAKDCTSLFLEKVIPFKDPYVWSDDSWRNDFWRNLDVFLDAVYSLDQSSSSLGGAGRSYECDDVLKKKHREKCNRLVQTKNVSSWAESIPEKLDELHKYFYKENDVQACWFYGNWLVKLVELYRSYLINNYAKCVYPSVRTVEKNKKNEKDFFDSITGGSETKKTENFFEEGGKFKKGDEIISFSSRDDISKFFNRFGSKNDVFANPYSEMDQKLIWLYEKFDLAYIEKILSHANCLLTKMRKVKDTLSEEVPKKFNIYVNEIILYCIGTIKRYRGHLYEMKANIAWIVCVKQQSLSLYQQIDDLIKRFPEVEEKVCTSIEKSIEEGLAALQ